MASAPETAWFAGNATEKHSIGAYFYGTKGTFHMGWRDGWTFYGTKGTFHMGWRDGWTFYPANGGPPVHTDADLQQPDGHNLTLLWADFINSTETGSRPVAEIEASHRSTTLSLLGMLSYKLGRSIRWDGDHERIIDDNQASALLRREYRAPWVYPVV